MPSLNDHHDYDHLRRVPHVDNIGFLHRPTDFNFNHFLHPPSAYSAESHHEGGADDGLHFTTLLPFSRPPLLLANNKPGGPSEFQSNGAFLFDSQEHINEHCLRQTNGLGLHLTVDRKESRIVEAACPADGSSGSLSPPMLYNLPDSSPAYLAMSDPFDDSVNRLVMLGGLTQSDIFSERRPLFAPVPPFSAILNTPLADYKHEEVDFSGGLTFSSSSYSIASPLPLVEPLMNLPGLVADINMFDKMDRDNGLYVRPQDLLRDSGQRSQQLESPPSVKFEETDVEAERAVPLASPTSVHASQPHWTPVSSGHVPDFVERYFVQPSSRHHSQDSQGLDAGSQDACRTLKQDRISASPSAIKSRLSPAYLYTPITAEILEAVEELTHRESPPKAKKGLTDRTNTSRSRTSVNVLELYGSLIPRDVILENPYEGVSAEDVAQKTKYFMMMHPGDRLSDELLFSFAGRLSGTGEPIQGYRCYVAGCLKTTRRKDHMGDHIRTHLGEKPFQCNICGLGFIRNNDCQRHENNHRPDKKFVCDCQAAFSRRDLFVRHQKTACSLLSGGFGFARRPRRYTKSSASGRKATPDGDDVNDLDYVPGESTMIGL